MKIHYLLIDYENVQPDSLPAIEAESLRIIVFVGANQSKVTFDAAAALQRMGNRAQYIKIAGNGPNALDFHIAFYIGQLAAQDAEACFYIISKDTGFDPLILHLKSRKMHVARYRDITDIPLFKAASPQSSGDRLAVIVANLRQRGTSRPRTVKTLESTISALFQKRLSAVEIATLLKELQARGLIVITDSKVSYALPS